MNDKEILGKMKAMKSNSEMSYKLFRDEYEKAKKKLAEQLIKEGIIHGKRIYFGFAIPPKLTTNSDKELDRRLSEMLALGSTVHYNDSVHISLDYGSKIGKRADIIFSKYKIDINFDDKIDAEDFKKLLAVIGVTDVYFNEIDFKIIEAKYKLGNMLRSVIGKRGNRYG